LTDVLYTYLQVDPFGYRDELDRGFAHLDSQITQDPEGPRFILNYRRIEYLFAIEEWDSAFALANGSLALADRCLDPDTGTWHGAWALFILCEICNSLGRMEDLAGYAEDLAERSTKNSGLDRTRASALLWKAVVQRSRGDSRSASRSFHEGLNHLKNL